MKTCKKCQSPIPKHKRYNQFCGLSCSSSYNNTHSLKRVGPDKLCKTCGIVIGKRWCTTKRYCELHRKPDTVSNRTVKEYLDTYTSRTTSNRYCGIRNIARRIMQASTVERVCQACGYKKHVEVCHIKSISSFPLDTLITEINDISNLMYLCPNCHWEFDHIQESGRPGGI